MHFAMSDVYADFGKRLREARQKASLTQEVLGQHVGLTRTSITNIEAGRQPVNLDLLYRLAAALQSDPRDLLPARSPQRAWEASASYSAKSRLPPLGTDAKSWVDKVLQNAKLRTSEP